MRAEGICASLRETLLVLIYTSMTTAQNELTVSRGTTTTKKQEIRKIDAKKWFNGGRAKEGRWPLLIDILYCHAAKHLSMQAPSN